jgi:hypothetical protein
MKLIGTSMFFALIALALLGAASEPAGAADECKDQLDRQMAERVASVSEVSLSPQPFSAGLKTFTVTLAASVIDATDYSCKERKSLEHPARTVTGWLYQFGPSPRFEVFDSEEQFLEFADKNEDYEANGAFITNVKAAESFEVESSIKFLLDHAAILGKDVLSYEVIVSGPFWRRVEFLEVPVGLIKSGGGELVSGLREFNAENVLCSNETGLELIGFDSIRRKEKTERFSVVKSVVEEYVREQCDDAIQIGPAYFEPNVEEAVGLVGVSGFSMKEGVRTALFETRTKEGKSANFMLTTAGPISSFDTMVLLVTLFEKIKLDGDMLVWAVGLQDDEYATGPVFVSEEKLLPVNDISVPTGALLLFKSSQPD